MAVTVHSQQLESFHAFVQETCPWFPEEGTVTEQTWQKVGLLLQQCFTLHGPWDFPVETFALWNLVKESLYLSLEVSHLPDKPLEGNVMAEYLKQTVTGYEVPLKSMATGSDETLPPTYELDNEPLPPQV